MIPWATPTTRTVHYVTEAPAGTKAYQPACPLHEFTMVHPHREWDNRQHFRLRKRVRAFTLVPCMEGQVPDAVLVGSGQFCWIQQIRTPEENAAIDRLFVSGGGFSWAHGSD